MHNSTSRRQFLQTAAAATTVPYLVGQHLLADEARSDAANDRPLVGCIGTGSRWGGVGNNAMRYGDVVAVCDVDQAHLDRARNRVQEVQDHTPDAYRNYREVLDRNDVEIVTIVTPDHWHTKIAIDAMRAGKDVYCEKPLTLTIEEGKQILQVQEETGRVFQVGTQQRSEMGLRFLTAVALIKEGRLGTINKVTVAIGGAPESGPLETAEPPQTLDWEQWLGQTPLVDYIPRRCHYEFRWWYEYSGGKMTDWGAHHVDIAQWAIGMDDTGPSLVSPIAVTHPVPFENGYPTESNQYNTATQFQVLCRFPNDVEMTINHATPDFGNGIMFEGTEGRIFVNRGRISGAPVEALEDNPLPEDALTGAYKGRQPGDHMRNFFECVKAREQPISDVASHHRAITTCHLANIAIRLNRELNWDAAAQQIVGDEEANAWQAREQRKGYEIEV